MGERNDHASHTKVTGESHPFYVACADFTIKHQTWALMGLALPRWREW